MNFINQLFNESQANFDPLNFIGIIVTVVASLYIFKNETSISFIRERHDKLISPLFNLLEPTLYKPIQPDIIEKALDIIDANKNLSDGKLLEIYYFCTINPSQGNFNSLCSYIDKSYDKSCRKLGLKTRSLLYRISREQYKSKIYLVLFIIVYAFIGLIVAVSMLFLFLCAISALYILFESVNPTQQIIMLIIGLIFFLAFIKYAEKNF